MYAAVKMYIYFTVTFALMIRCNCGLRKWLYSLCLAHFSLCNNLLWQNPKWLLLVRKWNIFTLSIHYRQRLPRPTMLDGWPEPCNAGE